MLALRAMETRLKGRPMESFRKNLNELGSETCSTCPRRLMGCMYILGVVYDEGKLVAHAIIKNGQCDTSIFYSLPCVNPKKSQKCTGGFKGLRIGKAKMMKSPRSFVKYLGVQRG